MIPQGVSEHSRDTYDITYYINDINREYVQTLMEYNPDNGDAEGIYDYGNERLNYYDEEEESYSYLYDGKGNVTGLAGKKGADVVSYTYSLYGETYADGESENPYTYNAEYTDYLTGNQYLRARYYRPGTGNFLTMDSETGDIEEPLSLNRYTYAANDPVNYSDPSGHSLFKKIGTGIKIIKTVKKKASQVAKKLPDTARTYIKKKVNQVKSYAKKMANRVVGRAAACIVNKTAKFVASVKKVA